MKSKGTEKILMYNVIDFSPLERNAGDGRIISANKLLERKEETCEVGSKPVPELLSFGPGYRKQNRIGKEERLLPGRA